LKNTVIFFSLFILASAAFYILGDAKQIDMALDVEIKIKKFCDDHRRYPTQNEFILLFPEISKRKDIKYWVSSSGLESMFQYHRDLTLPKEGERKKVSTLIPIDFNRSLVNPCKL